VGARAGGLDAGPDKAIFDGFAADGPGRGRIAEIMEFGGQRLLRRQQKRLRGDAPFSDDGQRPN
jgi:hypothetical protein